MLDFSTGLKLSIELYPLFFSLLILLIVPTIFVIIYTILFRRILPSKLFDFLIGPIVLLGFYVWAVPMEIGFYEFFRATL